MKKMGSMLKLKSCTAEFQNNETEDISVTPRANSKSKSQSKDGRTSAKKEKPAKSESEASSPTITILTCVVPSRVSRYVCKFRVQGNWQELPAKEGCLTETNDCMVTWNASSALPEAAAGSVLELVAQEAHPHSLSSAPHSRALKLGEVAPGETFEIPVPLLDESGHEWLMMVSLKGIRPCEEPAITIWTACKLPRRGYDGASVEFGVPGRGPMHRATHSSNMKDLRFNHKELLPENVQPGDKLKFTVSFPGKWGAEAQCQPMQGQLKLGSLSPKPGSRFERDVKLAGESYLKVILHGLRPGDATEDELTLEADQMRQESDYRKWNAAGRPGASVTPETFAYSVDTAHPPEIYFISVAGCPNTRCTLYVDKTGIDETGLRETFPLQGVSGGCSLEFTYGKSAKGTLQLGDLASDPKETYKRSVDLDQVSSTYTHYLPLILRGVRPCDLSEEEARAARLADQAKALADRHKKIGDDVREMLGQNMEDMLKAEHVDIISTPYYVGGKRPGQAGYVDSSGAAHAHAFKAKHKNTPKHFVFNPNDDLQDVAAAKSWDSTTQAQKWVEAWTTVLMLTKQTGGTCYVMRKKEGETVRLEGNAQQGEVNIMLLADCDPQYIDY